MAVSKNTLSLLKSLYWVILVFAHLWLCYKLFTTDHAITGVLWLILGFILIYIMYFFYFPPGDPGSSWPPYISTCPDYLTSVNPSVCMDFVGLNSPHLKQADPAHMPQPSDANYSQYVFDPRGSKADKTHKAQQYGLTWDGLF
jgi:hypothetical protein